MKPTSTVIALLFGWLAIHIAFSPVYVDALFFAWMYSAPFVLLCVLTLVFLIRSIQQFFVKNEKILVFLPVVISSICILVVVIQNERREALDNSATIFRASTREIGSDGGFNLYFKENGVLKAEKQDHWAVSYYWGEYHLKNDTVELDIPLDFKLGKKAVLSGKSLLFLDDSPTFEVYRLNY